MSRKRKKARKARCVRCKERMYFAPGGSGTKNGRRVCPKCQWPNSVGTCMSYVDGDVGVSEICAGETPTPIPPEKIFRSGETIQVRFDLDTHEVVSVASGPADLDPLDGWPGWE